jgi:hypothetical protein
VEKALPARIAQLLKEEPDLDFSVRLGRIYEAATRAVEKLGELDLVKYEESPLEASADLSLWESVAPVVGSTIADVNALLLEMRAQFPETAIVVDPKQNEIDRLIQDVARWLKERVMQFGMQIRDPSIVGDRWNLAGELQRVRFEFRERIGLFMFESALQLGDCRRIEVDPSCAESVAAAVLVRTVATDLRRLMRAHMHQIAESQGDDAKEYGLQIERALDAFGKTAAFKALQAPQKKTIIEFKTVLTPMVAEPTVAKYALMAKFEPFVESLDSIEGTGGASLLEQHDQETRAQVGVCLERALGAGSFQMGLASFQEAAALAQRLYGRSSEFDGFLRKVKRSAPTEETLQVEIEAFLILLSSLDG